MAKLNGDSILRSCELKGPLPHTALRANTQFAEFTASSVFGSRMSGDVQFGCFGVHLVSD